MSTKEEILSRIKALREERGLSQSQFADELGIGRTTYLNFETGKTRLFSKNLVALAEYFQLSEEEILCGEKPSEAVLRDVEDFEEKRLALITEYEARLSDLNTKLQQAQQTIEDNKQIIQSLTQTNQFLLSRLNKND